MKYPPKWAQELLLEALEYCELKGFTIPPINLIWKNKQRRGSSGVWYCDKNEIHITAGRERRDCKLVLLHEATHSVLPRYEFHSKQFWGLAWELYRYFKLPIRYCLSRERDYRKSSLIGYKNKIS